MKAAALLKIQNSADYTPLTTYSLNNVHVSPEQNCKKNRTPKTKNMQLKVQKKVLCVMEVERA